MWHNMLMNTTKGCIDNDIYLVGTQIVCDIY